MASRSGQRVARETRNHLPHYTIAALSSSFIEKRWIWQLVKYALLVFDLNNKFDLVAFSKSIRRENAVACNRLVFFFEDAVMTDIAKL